ncbi:glycosyltransferase family 4 protein, partial [Candidatus Saccharibacteria bacterium]|nr:glycosyltransferase family 4 protein [Candidatus Saccharibacteria bacterium]
KKYWEKIHQPNFEYRFLPHNMFEYRGNPIAIFLSYMVRVMQVRKILNSEKVQTIYSSSDIAYADIWPAYWFIGRHPKAKWISRIYHVILSPHHRQGNYFVNAIAFWLQRLSFWMMKRRSTTILALNDKLYDEVLELGFPKNRLGVLGAGIDFKFIHQHRAKKKYPYDVVVLGRLTPVKGIFDMIKIWDRVHKKKPNLRLAWMGGGADNYQRKIEEQLSQKDLVSTFELLGFLDKDKVYDVLKSAKVFLCPDHENGWGLAVCEAMSSGLPVVSYNLDIFGSVYKKGYTSVPLYDTKSFADELLDLLNDEPRRKKMAKDAADQARQFDHDRVTAKLVEYIK